MRPVEMSALSNSLGDWPHMTLAMTFPVMEPAEVMKALRVGSLLPMVFVGGRRRTQ